jgi:hypothetical protein
MIGAQAARSPFVAGLGTAVRGLADKALDPALTGVMNASSKRGIGASADAYAHIHDDETQSGVRQFY